ncbi:MAG: YkgJ family cysteine cluster protein [Dehalococcoidales bacterium]|nr:YkgJ family cysteine cluster protein [Dehalococcoidales bacterium]
MAGPVSGESFRSYAVQGLPNTASNLEWLREHFECEQCGQCCCLHSLGVRVTRSEAEQLAQRERLSLKEYAANVLEDRGTFIIRQPCRHLVDNRCVVHDIKPSVCRKYPFHRYEEVDRDTAWVIIVGCPGGQKLLNLLSTGKQEGLEYRPIKT